MASSRTQLVVEILTDTARATQGINESAARFESFAKKAAGVVAGAFAVDKIGQGAKAVISAASDMEQAVGGVDLIFKQSANVIHQWASDTTDDFRVPAVQAEKFAATMGNALQQAGRSAGEAAVETKQLAQVAADLAAAYGGSVVDALDAVNAAISKGEWERLETFGVTIKASDIAAEMDRIAESFGGLNSSTEAAIRTQASINLLMREAAPALGAAASESDTFAARVDSLKEQASALAVVVGGPLLDSLGGIVGSATSAASGVETLGIGLGTMLGTVLSLPGPIQAVVASLAAFGVVSALWGTKALGAFTSFVGGVRTATTSVAGLRTALATIGPALAGGALLVGAAVLIGVIATAIGRVSQAAKTGEDSLQGYRDAIVAAGGASNEATAEAFRQAVVTSEAFDLLVTGGYSAAEATKILTGTQEEWIAIQGNGSEASQNLTKDMLAQTNGFIDANGHAKTLAQAQLDGIAALGGHADATDEDAAKLAEQAEAAAASEEATKKLAEALKTAQAAADNTDLSRGLDQAATELDNIKRAAEFVRLEFDKMSGRAMGIDDAAVAWSAGVRNLTGNLKDYTTEVDSAATALVTLNTTQLGATSEGEALWTGLRDQADLYAESIANTWTAARTSGKSLAESVAEVKGVAGPARQSLVDMLAPLAGGAEQASALLTQMGFIDATEFSDKTFEAIMVDERARAKVAELQAAQIGAKEFEITAGADGAMGTVDDLISYVDGAGVRVDPIPLTADSDPAEGTADDFTSEKRQTNEVAILANSSPARRAMQAFISDYSRLTIPANVIANTASARNSVEAFRRDYAGLVITTTILGNSAPARNSINDLLNNYYSLTVYIRADAASFYATYNSLPTSKTITQNVVTVGGGVGGGAVPQLASVSTINPDGRLSLGRSSATPSLVRTTPENSAAGTVINVNGALDPDAVARQISTILRNRARRSGGVEVGQQRAISWSV